MQFVLVSSLESIALTSVTATLLNNHTNRGFFSEVVPVGADHYGLLNDDFFGVKPNDDTVWFKVRENAEVNVHELTIPECLKKKLTSYVYAASWDILQWLRFHATRNKLLRKVPEKFLWTPHGTIDIEKTALMLVCDNTIDINARFKLACMYCFEDHIYTLWDQLDEESRRPMQYSSPVSVKQMHILVFYWSHRIRAKEDVSSNLFLSFVAGLHQSLHVGNVVAVKFFLSKVTDEQKNQYLVKFITGVFSKDIISIGDTSTYHQCTEILCFILNSLDAEKQMTVLSSFPYMVLFLFLQWPWQDYFIKVHQCVGHLLHSNEFYDLLKQIILKLDTSCKDYDYESIFIYFWLHSPVQLRMNIHNPLFLWLPKLYKLGNWQTFNLISRDADTKQREELLHSFTLREMFAELIAENNWDAIKFFVTNCLLSVKEVIEFRVLMNMFHNKPAVAEHFRKFNDLFDDVNLANKKRHVANDDNESKRACLSKI